ncbi:hypothetical protein E3N88_06449 [Mikania micrantha]|uniref:Uncharacterized protein n=1 Tax=Mikania micrantha TaxID=192012 RepID=A0A5N6PNS0_9ASTR|nr:hypothetical protein E3N88_06449 [Mikania micrantha]
MTRKKSERIAMKTSFSKFVNSPLDPIQLGDSDTDINTPTDVVRDKRKMLHKSDIRDEYLAKRFKTNDEKLKLIMEIKANLENVSKKMEEDKESEMKKVKMSKKRQLNKKSSLKIKKAKKTMKKKINKNSDYELDDEESDDPDYENNLDEIIEKVVTSDKRKKWFGIVTRSSPKQFYTAIKSLNKRQRDLVRSMGFGKLLSFNVSGIPSKLGHYVVDNLDTSRMVIKTSKGDVKVDKESVNALLGLPLGGIDISALTEANESTKLFSKWRRRYGKRRISPAELVSNISIDKYEDDLVFKLDFLVLFLTTIDCWKNGLCKYALIERLDLEVDLKDYDWCGYVVDAIRRGKDDWKREVSAIQFWSFENLQKREGIEIKEGGFGLGEIREHFFDEVNYEMESEEPLLEGDNNDDGVETINKFDENTVKGRISMLSSIYSRILKDKKAFAKAIVETRKSFPDDNIVAEFVNKYDEVFNDELDFDNYILSKRETNIKAASVEHVETAISSKGTNNETNKELPETVGDLTETYNAGVWTQEVIKVVDNFEGSSSFKGKSVESDKFKLNLEEVPTFSLGLTQETQKVDTCGDLTQEMLDAAVEIEKLYGLKKLEGKNTLNDQKGKDVNEKDGMGSLEKKDKCLSAEEKKIWNYLVNGAVDKEKEAAKVKEGDHGKNNEVERTFGTDIFATENGTRSTHFNFNSLLPRQEVFNDVIDCWVAVLNFEEKNRSPSSLRRLFCPTTPFYGWVPDNSDETDETRYAFFETHLHAVLEGNEKLYDLKQFDVVLFPIFEKRHFYLMSFDLKNPCIRLIDNMHASQCLIIFRDDVDYLKKSTCYKVKYIFLLHLKKVNHPKVKELEWQSVEKLKLSWATTKNFVDCGIFVMRHKEMFNANYARSWDCGFPKDERAKKMKCGLLRKKYACKMLTSDVNIYKDRIIKEADELDAASTKRG